MNPEVKEAFTRIKPVCDLVMLRPTPENIAAFSKKVAEMKLDAVQELQQYILFPFITHVKSEEIEKKFELLRNMADAMKQVLDRVTVTSFEMCMKIETALLSVVFDNSKPGMVSGCCGQREESASRRNDGPVNQSAPVSSLYSVFFVRWSAGFMSVGT